MVEYARHRLAAAKVGVSLALLALIGGVAAKKEQWVSFEEVASQDLPRNSVGTKHVKDDALLYKDLKQGQVYSVLTVDELFQKAYETDAATYLKISDAEVGYVKWDEANNTFLKVADADMKYLKIDDANATFLKIDDANETFYKHDEADATFLKIDDANANFLKIDDAYGKFLKLDGKAADAEQIDGLDSTELVQGNGSVLSGIASVERGSSATVLAVPETAEVGAVLGPDDPPEVQITNPGAGSLQYVADDRGGTIEAGGSATIPLDQASDSLTLQLFSTGERPVVTTVTVSAAGPVDGGAPTRFVGQALVGAPGESVK